MYCRPSIQDINKTALVSPWTVAPATLLCPWNFPGKKTGVGCHFLPHLSLIYSLNLKVPR